MLRSICLFLFTTYQKNQNSSLALHELLQELSAHQNKKIEIRANRKNHSISFDDIDYFESLGDFVKVHLSDRQLVTKEKISHLEKRLPGQFVRIHRSFIINRLKVESYNKEQVVLKGHSLTISRTYKDSVLAALDSSRSSA